MLKVGDTIEILEPEDRDNYPYGWNSNMDRLVTTKDVVTRVRVDSQKRIRYNLSDNSYDWHESNLKLISRNATLSNIDVNEPVMVTEGEYVGEIDTIESCYYKHGGLHYFLQRSNYILNSDQLKPLNHMVALF